MMCSTVEPALADAQKENRKKCRVDLDELST